MEISKNVLYFFGLAILIVTLRFSGCSCQPSSVSKPVDTRNRISVKEPEIEDEYEEALFDKPSSLNLKKDLDPVMRSRLTDLERDYFEGRFDFVVPGAEELLKMVGEDRRMQLRLYYLLARSHARNRNPRQAQHYEKLFRKLFVSERESAPKVHKGASKITEVMKKSEVNFKKVHPNWDLDGDGQIWANVLVWRKLDREGPHAVVSIEHPGGGTIHASQSGANLQGYLENLGLLKKGTVLQRDQRFGFYFLISAN